MVKTLVNYAFALAVFSLNKYLAELKQALFCLHKLLLTTLAVALLLQKLSILLNSTRSTFRVTSDVEEVDVSVQKSTLHQLNGLRLGINLIL